MSRLAAELPKEETNGTNGTTQEPQFEIPKTYMAAIYDKPGTISTKVVELEIPVPGSGQVLIHLTHSGVCKFIDAMPLRPWPYPRSPFRISFSFYPNLTQSQATPTSGSWNAHGAPTPQRPLAKSAGTSASGTSSRWAPTARARASSSANAWASSSWQVCA